MTVAVYGYELQSAVALDHARSGPGNRGQLRIELSDEDLLDGQGELIVWIEEPQSFAVFRVPDGLLVWCQAAGVFRVDARAGVIKTAPAGAPDVWEHRLCATALPLLLAERGDLALHGATVIDGPRAVAFCGASGSGKSTLGAALGLSGRVVAAEDGTIISGLDERPVVWPGPMGVRVTAATWACLGGHADPGAPADKAIRRCETDRLPLPGSRELTTVVVLRPRGGRRLELRRLDPVTALRALMPNAIYAGPGSLAATMELVARLADRVAVFEARLPDDLLRVRAVALEILQAVSPDGAALSAAPAP